LPAAKTEAQAVLEQDAAAVGRLASNLLKPSSDNLVERPWGGMRMAEFKRISHRAVRTGFGLGEAFEIAADDTDEEARRYPSRICFADGSELTLPALLAKNADILLGRVFTQRYGARFPLLPKTLDIAELLSVQGHPEGNTEVYVIIEAEPGATIRLGFNADVDAAAIERRLTAGRREQQQLLDILGAAADANALQSLLQPWFAQRTAEVDAIEPGLRAMAAVDERWSEVASILQSLHALYWDVLDLMNEIPVAAGQVIHNTTPARIAAAAGKAPSAEVHALGNPERREILALEIRRPGPTFRAWDNVRFPLRDIDVAAAIAALNLRRTDPADFIVEPEPVPGRPGVMRSVDSACFRLEHLLPTAKLDVEVPAEGPHCLHALGGAVTVRAHDHTAAGQLVRGESAIVPIGIGAYRLTADTPEARIVKVSLPDAR
jgi:mannose-6-phosphate isomerase class I